MLESIGYIKFLILLGPLKTILQKIGWSPGLYAENRNFILREFHFNVLYVRGGPNFDPVKYVKEVSHVEHMHADSILIHPNFSSKLMIT